MTYSTIRKSQFPECLFKGMTRKQFAEKILKNRQKEKQKLVNEQIKTMKTEFEDRYIVEVENIQFQICFCKLCGNYQIPSSWSSIQTMAPRSKCCFGF